MFQVYIQPKKKTINELTPTDRKSDKYKIIKRNIDQGFCIFS